MGKIRCMKLSPYRNLSQLFCGDKCGYLWIFDSNSMKLLDILEAHQDQVLGLDFSPIGDPEDDRGMLLATSSRDKEVRIYDTKNNYNLANIIDDHESTVIGLNFVSKLNNLSLCSIDCKSNIILRPILPDGSVGEASIKSLPPKTTMSGVMKGNTVAVGTDTKIQLGELKSKDFWSFNKSVFGNSSTSKDFIALEMDEGGVYLLASSKKNKDISVIDIKSGQH